MERRGLVAGALALLAATASCTPPVDGEESDARAEPEVPLDLTLDHVDVSHGSMRVRATMTDGSPDVSFVLGEDCDRREVGRGVATRVSLVWSLDEQDVADALRCGLAVRARAWTDRGRVAETATLELVPDVTLIPEAEAEGKTGADDAAGRPELEALGRAPTEMGITFRSVTPSATLAIADLRIERTRDEDDEGDTDDSTAAFAVPYAAFARAVLEDRPLRIDATAFGTSLTVGGTALEREPPADPVWPSDVEGTGDPEESSGVEALDGVEDSAN